MTVMTTKTCMLLVITEVPHSSLTLLACHIITVVKKYTNKVWPVAFRDCNSGILKNGNSGLSQILKFLNFSNKISGILDVQYLQ